MTTQMVHDKFTLMLNTLFNIVEERLKKLWNFDVCVV